MLLAALGPGRRVAGLDVSLEWLVVAQRLTMKDDIEAELAAGHAKAMPLAAGTIGAVEALDGFWHAGDQVATIGEINRVPKSRSVGSQPTTRPY